jgi:hypothetical protein
MNPPTYRYLLAYTYDNGTRFARIDITSPAPVRSMRDVDIVEADLRRSTGFADAMILSFSAFASLNGR